MARRSRSWSARALLAASLTALASCSLALDFASDPDGRPDARPRDVDAQPEPPDFDSPPAPPDAITIDATPRCRTEAGEPDLLDPETGNCFIFLETFGRPYETARTECTAFGARLASITTAREFQLIMTRLVDAPYWIGLDDLAVEGTFVWMTPEAGTFTNWRMGEPNDAEAAEDCTVVYGNYVGEFAAFTGGWNDVLCTRTMYAICERPAL